MAQPFYVSPKGDDANPGTEEAPFQTIQKAADWAARSQSTVYLRQGLYRLQSAIELKSHHSGIRIEPYQSEQVTLSGAIALDQWKLVKHPRPSKDRPAKVYMAETGKYANVLTLYGPDGLLPRAASAPLKTVSGDLQPTEGGSDTAGQGESIPTPSTMFFLPGQIDHVQDFANTEIFILPRADWVANYLPVKHVDRQSRRLETYVPGTYALTTPPTWTQIELFYRLENAPEFLDEPGEWYFDAESSRIYLVAPADEAPKHIELPVLDQLFSLEGDFENNDLISDIKITGLSMQHTTRMTWAGGRIGVQHDWGVADGQWAFIKVKGARGIEVSNCLFEHGGGDGVRLDVAGWNNRIHHNEFSHLGGAAVSLIGLAPGTRDELHSNHVYGNHIHHCAELWWLQPGIMVCQSSTNRIANNLIHDLPYNGIALVGGRAGFFGRGKSDFPGNGLSYMHWDEIPQEVDEWYEKIGYISTRDNMLEHNEIHHVVERLGDGNAIYLSGVGTGNILQNNYIHDMPSFSSAGGLRFDNDTWFCTMRNNVVWNVNGANIVSKWVNTVENNIMVNSAVRSNLMLTAGPKWGSNIRRNIIVNNRQLYEPTMNKWMLPEQIFMKGELEQCIITNNLFFVSDDEAFGQERVEEINNLFNAADNLHADPQFLNIDQGNFGLEEDSPALKMGFIPIEKYGLTEKAGRNP
jgi:hypothetical protein